MAPSKPALDLNAMIIGDRQRRKNESLAQSMFGTKNRRASAPGALNKRKSGPIPAVPSLANRITGPGISKRSAATIAKPARAQPAAGNVNAEWTHDFYALNNAPAAKVSPFPPRGPKAVRSRTERLQSALNGSVSSPNLNSQFNIVGASKPKTTFSIRGLAGPYIVVVKNLVAGTTAADIESALTPVGGVVLSSRIIAERPQVIAELIFDTKHGADSVVETFNHQNADGNILQVYHKLSPISQSAKLLSAQPAPKTPVARHTPTAPRADLITDRTNGTRTEAYTPDRYDQRDRSQERRREHDRNEVTDGSYGFEDRMDTDDQGNADGGRGLYSDTMISKRGRGRGNNRERGGRGDRFRGYR